MLDPSIEELREYVNGYKLNNNHETNTKNGATQYLSDDELIKLLESESDTSGNMVKRFETAHLTGMTVNSNVDVQNGSNVLKVSVNDVEGLTLEIRESFYKKLCNALSSNYKPIFYKQDNICLTALNICDIAKKMEYGILSTAKDLNSYKLAGADAIVNIEKETCYRNLYKSLFNEIELLRLRSKMQIATSKIPQQEPTVSSTETESPSCKESEFQDAQSKTEPMAVDPVNNNSVKMLDSPSATVSESEYFSCSSTDHSSVESQQNSETCSINNNTQEPIMDLSREKRLKDGELQSISTDGSVSVDNHNSYVFKILADPSHILNDLDSSNIKVKLEPVCNYETSQKISCSPADDRPVESRQNSKTCTTNSNNTQAPMIDLPREKQLKELDTGSDRVFRSISANDSVSVCNNNDNVKKIPTVSSNVPSGTNTNAEKEFDSVGTKGISQNKRRGRKRKIQCGSESSTNSLPVKQKKNNVNTLRKKQILIESEATSETSTTTTDANNKNTEKSDSHLKDCSQVRLDTNAKKMDETPPIQPIKLEPACIKTEPTPPSPANVSCNQCNNIQISLKNNSMNGVNHQKRCELNNNEINSINEKNKLQGRIKTLFPPNAMCTIQTEILFSQFSIGMENEELINETFLASIAVKSEKSSSVHEVSSNGLEDDAMLQNSEHNLKSRPASSTQSENNTEVTASEESGAASSTQSENNTEVTPSEESSVPDVNASIDSYESNVPKENNCLIDEKAFELERARLDKLREEMKKCNEESNVDVIHSDYKKIFGIIIPIIRKYYPSEFIPDEVCYGHILQNLQIDLTHTDMCDDDIALYIKDSIKTRKYLYENCIIQ